ncbi:MAG: OmpA family protein [Hyphomonadaceae bacterium]|nr:OmpA family protein [Hyphomonadaceae bacterium]MBC6411978.1 OmpA family protein [Hyphomonadaceae bacterium]
MTDFLKTASRGEEQWISVSDMMAGLMMIFLFISIIYMRDVKRERDRIDKYFTNVDDVSDEICDDLKQEFKDDAENWDISICESGLLISFDSDSSFELNSAELSEAFRFTLEDFFPRLMTVVYEYKDDISELRIEGHTDSSVRRSDTELSGYLYNTKLSQERSRNVMDFSLNLERLKQEYLDWSYTHVTAHGMSSSNKVFTRTGAEDHAASRRVEFRLRTTAEEDLLNLVPEIVELRD